MGIHATWGDHTTARVNLCATRLEVAPQLDDLSVPNADVGYEDV